MDISILPSVNASLNAASTILLFLGYWFIRKKEIDKHKICMLAACGTSALFLVFYLYYHYHHGSTKFTASGWIRPIYFSILLSHTILAALIVPMILMTLRRAFKSDFTAHAKIARKTFPLWMYVSLTGIVIYWLLYHVYKPA